MGLFSLPGRGSFSFQEVYGHFTKKRRCLHFEKFLNTLFNDVNRKYGFLDKSQVWGRIFKHLKIPNVCGEVNKKGLRKLALKEQAKQKAKNKCKLNVCRMKYSPTKSLADELFEQEFSFAADNQKLTPLKKNKGILKKSSFSQKNDFSFKRESNKSVTFNEIVSVHIIDDSPSSYTVSEQPLEDPAHECFDAPFLAPEKSHLRENNKLASSQLPPNSTINLTKGIFFETDEVNMVYSPWKKELETQPFEPSSNNNQCDIKFERKYLEHLVRQPALTYVSNKEKENTPITIFSSDSSLNSSLEEDPLKRSIVKIVSTLPSLNEESFSDDNCADTGVISEDEAESESDRSAFHFDKNDLRTFTDLIEPSETTGVDEPLFGCVWRELVKPTRIKVSVAPRVPSSSHFSKLPDESIAEVSQQFDSMSLLSRASSERSSADFLPLSQKIKQEKDDSTELNDLSSGLVFQPSQKIKKEKDTYEHINSSNGYDTTVSLENTLSLRKEDKKRLKVLPQDNILTQHFSRDFSNPAALMEKKQFNDTNSGYIYMNPDAPTKRDANIPTYVPQLIQKKTPLKTDSTELAFLKQSSTLKKRAPTESQNLIRYAEGNNKLQKVVRKINFDQADFSVSALKTTKVIEKGFQRYVDQKYRLTSSSENESSTEDSVIQCTPFDSSQPKISLRQDTIRTPSTAKTPKGKVVKKTPFGHDQGKISLQTNVIKTILDKKKKDEKTKTNTTPCQSPFLNFQKTEKAFEESFQQRYVDQVNQMSSDILSSSENENVGENFVIECTPTNSNRTTTPLRKVTKPSPSNISQVQKTPNKYISKISPQTKSISKSKIEMEGRAKRSVTPHKTPVLSPQVKHSHSSVTVAVFQDHDLYGDCSTIRSKEFSKKNTVMHNLEHASNKSPKSRFKHLQTPQHSQQKHPLSLKKARKKQSHLSPQDFYRNPSPHFKLSPEFGLAKTGDSKTSQGPPKASLAKVKTALLSLLERKKSSPQCNSSPLDKMSRKRKPLADITPLETRGAIHIRDESFEDSDISWSPERKKVHITSDFGLQKTMTASPAKETKKRSSVATWSKDSVGTDTSCDESTTLNRRLYYMGCTLKE